MLQLTAGSGQGGWGSGRQLTIPGEHTQKSVGERQCFLNTTCCFSLQTLWKNSGWPETGLPFAGYTFSGTYDQVIPEIPREAIVEKTFYSFRQICSLLRLHVPSGLHSPSEQCLLGLTSPFPERTEGKALRWQLCCLIFMLIQNIRRAWRNHWQF